MRASEKQLAELLKKAFGNMSGVANQLGVSRQAVAERVAKSPALQAIREEAAETIVDMAESKLARAVGAGQEWAVRRVLDSKRGAKRGWRGEARHLEVEGRHEVQVARLDEQLGAEILARLAEPEPPPPATLEAPKAKKPAAKKPTAKKPAAKRTAKRTSKRAT